MLAGEPAAGEGAAAEEPTVRSRALDKRSPTAGGTGNRAIGPGAHVDEPKRPTRDELVHERRHLAAHGDQRDVPPRSREGDVLVAELDPGLWPSGWDRDVHSDATRTLGDKWARSRSSVGLIVPSSAGTPPSFNVLVNPEHPDAGRIQIERTTPFAFNARLGTERS